VEVGLLLRAVVARVNLVVVGEHPQSLGHVGFVRKAQSQRASILAREPQVELPALDVVGHGAHHLARDAEGCE
jgi:hypothetical protein